MHTGLFLAWLADRGMVSDLLATESAQRVAAIRDRRGRPADLYAEWDGVLAAEMLNDEANAFTRNYYERFLDDYAGAFPEAGSWVLGRLRASRASPGRAPCGLALRARRAAGG